VSFTLKLLLGVGIVWAALMPPLFTHGACTAEYEAENARLEREQQAIRTPTAADAWYSARGVPHATLSVDECRRRKPRGLSSCGDGPLVVANVPVMNLVCRIYRDDRIAVMLQYDGRDRLVRVESEMNPFKSLPLPWGGAIHWAR
jgi:hypothetical protein